MSDQAEAVAAGDRVGPRDPLVARAPFFYGWLMLPVATVTQILTVPGQTVGVAVFTAALAQSLSISESQLTGAYGLGTLLASLPLPLVGGLADRYGIRRTLTCVVLLFGGACLLMSQVRGLAGLLITFFLLRLLGQGSMSLLAGNSVSMWFHKRLGTVTGLMNVSVVLALGQAPLLLRLLTSELGWRKTYAVMGLVVWAILLPLLAIFFRNRPEDVGLQPDGWSTTPHPLDAKAGSLNEQPSANAPRMGVELDLWDALRTPTYWIMLAIFVAWAMIGTALVFNAQKLYELRGLSTDLADIGLMAFFTCMAGAQLVGGLLADRFRARWLMGASLAGMFAASVGLAVGWPLATLPSYMLFGAAQGILVAACASSWARYFGRANLGKIRSVAMTAAVAGSSVGPFIMGWCFDAYGSYDVSLWTFAVFLALLVPAGCLAVSPQDRLPVSSST